MALSSLSFAGHWVFDGSGPVNAKYNSTAHITAEHQGWTDFCELRIYGSLFAYPGQNITETADAWITGASLRAHWVPDTNEVPTYSPSFMFTVVSSSAMVPKNTSSYGNAVPFHSGSSAAIIWGPTLQYQYNSAGDGTGRYNWNQTITPTNVSFKDGNAPYFDNTEGVWRCICDWPSNLIGQANKTSLTLNAHGTTATAGVNGSAVVRITFTMLNS